MNLGYVLFSEFFALVKIDEISNSQQFIYMKSMITLICQLVGVFLVFAFLFSLGNYFFGWHLGMKGQEVPGDPRAAAVFLGIGLVLGGCAYFLGRAERSNRPDNPSSQ